MNKCNDPNVSVYKSKGQIQITELSPEAEYAEFLYVVRLQILNL